MENLLFERSEYEKMMHILGIGEDAVQNTDEIKRPNRNYLVAWELGYIESDGKSSARTI